MAKKTTDFKKMSEAELSKKLVDLHSEIFDIQMKAKGAKAKDVKKPSIIKKDIARILTEMSSRKNKK